LNSYEWDKHGFVILEQFFRPEELDDLSQLASQNVVKGGPDVYPTFALAQYDLIQAAHIRELPYLARMSEAVEKVMGTPISFYNSLYLEVHADKADAKPGLGWHQDTASFAILEKGTSACFCWTIIENSLDDGQGTLELILRQKVTELTGCDLRERCVVVFDTADLAKRHGIDLRWKAKYLLLDAITYQILSFFDTPMEQFAERPVLRRGDLLICNRDIMHRSAPTKAEKGERSALTMRFVDPKARYNGCLDDGVPLYMYGVYHGSKLWQRLVKEKRGAYVVENNGATAAA